MSKSSIILQYCDKNELLICASRDQIAELFENIGSGMPLYDVATIIWALSSTKKKPDEIENDLREVLNNAENETGTADP